MDEPIMIRCEGSGGLTHNMGTLGRICSMCGVLVPTINERAVTHTRQDFIAMIERGDFDA